ncbi:unnamed protein product [Cuscuta europaea]|uniref:Methyltransferase-like protein 22 n=1 Tax=Cuscuta europaea TaxID=41803 RepID=A0A9P0YSW9_CUSEU|nr:unnamed protein product [Cuscuta europaea]
MAYAFAWMENRRDDQEPFPSSRQPCNGGGPVEEEHVMSEVHLGCPPYHSGTHLSRFSIYLPPRKVLRDCNTCTYAGKCDHISRPETLNLDADGDLILTRRRKAQKNHIVITIHHNITSSLPRVGLQIWRAELVLSDFVLHMISTSSIFDGTVAVELGAGTGMAGMILAHVARTVFLTDHGEEVLDNCAKNVQNNAGVFHPNAQIHVRELDWKGPWPPKVAEYLQPVKRNIWTQTEIEELKKASILLAADVIYSDDLTDAFFSILEQLMAENPEKVLYLALEKRYNFTLDDLHVVANGYSHFRSYLEGESNELVSSPYSRCFLGKQINLKEIPKYVREYDRGDNVEIWVIKYKHHQMVRIP